MRKELLFLGLWVVAVVGLASAMPTIVNHYAATDNVRELFRADGRFFISPHVWFLLLCLIVPTTASLAVGHLRQRRPGMAALLAVAAPLAGWFCLRFAVTVESIHDILGAPVLGWPLDLEYILRFSMVFCTLWLITAIGVLPGLWRSQIPVAQPPPAVSSRM